MINPDKNLTDKALAGAEFLRTHAKCLSETNSPLGTISAEVHLIAADAVWALVKENAELRAQLAALRSTADTTFASDPAKNNSEHACYTPFVKGARVCLKVYPEQRGTVESTSTDTRNSHLVFVRFDSPFETNRWIKAKNLELIPGDMW